MSDRELLKDKQIGAAKGDSAFTDADDAVRECHEETFVFDANDASGDVAELGIACETKPFKLKRVVFTPDSDLAADVTDYVTHTVARREAGSLGTAHAIATLDTNSAGGNRSLTAWTGAAFDATAAQVALRTFAVGDCLTYASAKGGAPTAPKGKVAITVEYI